MCFLVFFFFHPYFATQNQGSKIMELCSRHGQEKLSPWSEKWEGASLPNRWGNPWGVFSLDPPLEGGPSNKAACLQQGRQRQPRLCICPRGGHDTEWMMKLQLFKQKKQEEGSLGVREFPGGHRGGSCVWSPKHIPQNESINMVWTIIPKALRSKLQCQHGPATRLVHRRHTCGKDPRGTAKSLKTKLTLEPKPTESIMELTTEPQWVRWLWNNKTQMETNILQRILTGPRISNVLKMPTCYSKIGWQTKKQNILSNPSENIHINSFHMLVK